MMTIRQVADYYEVDYRIIQKVYQRNKSEIDSDGTAKKTLQDFKDFLNTTKCSTQDFFNETKCLTQNFTQLHGRAILTLGNGITLEIPNSGTTCFSQRAVLRIGMLLRDSEVAKEVRTQLLNAFEKTTPEQRISDLTDEENICFNIVRAMMSGDIEQSIIGMTEYVQFNNRHITELQDRIKELESENKKLSESNTHLQYDTIDYDTKQSLNTIIRKMAGSSGEPISYVYTALYNLLQERYGIALLLRGDKPYINNIRKCEVSKVIDCFTALGKKYEVNADRILQSVDFPALTQN